MTLLANNQEARGLTCRQSTLLYSSSRLLGRTHTLQLSGRWSVANRLLLLQIIYLLSGCGDIYLDAPRSSNILLMSENAPAKIHEEQVVWFKYWGNEPFSEAETHAGTIIQKYNLKEARIYMVNTFTDGIISTFTGPFGFPRRTLVVEGNSWPNEDDRTTAP